MVLGTLISHPELLNRETLYELRSIVARYPYFEAARLLMLRNLYLLHDPDFGTELRRSVLYVGDRRALCRLIEGYADRVVDDKPEGEETGEPSLDRTMSLIDAFLGTLPEEEHKDDTLIAVEAVGDYAAMFLAGEDSDVEAEASLPDLAADLAVPSVPLAEKTEESIEQDGEESLEESYFTETLAKIYIKQHKYSRALEIIRSLYLQFPEKNAYFADQIRFLEKLIINNNLK